jgi:hypothetical protein
MAASEEGIRPGKSLERFYAASNKGTIKSCTAKSGAAEATAVK